MEQKELIVKVTVKQAGKRKEYIRKKELVLPVMPTCLRELITEIVQITVEEYNNLSVEPSILMYLSSESIEDQAQTGKVSFGDRKNNNQADVTRAIETALLAFEDGIYRVFIGDDEIISLDAPIIISEGDILTFIRLTMLSGRMW